MGKTADTAKTDQNAATGFLTTIERVGNMVPHPAIIFFILIGIVIVLSVILGLHRLVGHLRGRRPGDATRSCTQTTSVRSLLSADGIRFIFTSIVPNFMNFGARRRDHRGDDRRRRRRGIRPDRDAGAQDRRDRAPLDLHLHHRDARRRLLDRRRRRLPGAGAARRPRPSTASAAIRSPGSRRPSRASPRSSSSTSS